MNALHTLHYDVPAGAVPVFMPLDPAMQERVYLQYLGRRKDADVALCLAWLATSLLYSRQYGLFAVYLLTCGGFGIWWLIELFMAKNRVTEYNTKIILDIIAAHRQPA